jgi:hypothetical protein
MTNSLPWKDKPSINRRFMRKKTFMITISCEWDFSMGFHFDVNGIFHYKPAIEVSPFMKTPWIIFDDLSLNSTGILGGALKKEDQAPKALHQTYLF